MTHVRIMTSAFGWIAACILALGISSISVNAQSEIGPLADDEELEMLLELCEGIICYSAGEVQVNLEDGSIQVADFEYPLPIVQEGGFVSLFPGKTILLEADIENDRFVDVRAVEEPSEDGQYLELTMWQESDESDTFLRVTNYFSEVVKFRAGMILPHADDIYETSSCPVLNDGRVSFEHWPHPIFQLVLLDFHFISGLGDTLLCE